MIELADVFRRFAADYLSAHGASMLPSHRRAVDDILACRTAALGGQVWHCERCDGEVFSYHSCRNRSCPKCHTAQTRQWLERRQAEMLPAPYFHIIVTVPAELREVLRANQRDGYALLMQASAAAIIELARDPRYVGGTVGVLAVLHTWTQQLIFHPHVHCLVSGGGISNDGSTWHPARRTFLVPIKALARLVRGKLRALLQRKRPDLVIPGAVWRKDWILHVTAWGNGDRPYSTISPATSFASLSPTLASSASTTKRSASNTRTATPAACEPAASAATSSCAAFSSTCCRAASTRCVILVCGIPLNATTPPGCGRCCNSRRHPRSTRRRTVLPRRSDSPAQSRRRRTSRGSVRGVARGG